MACGIKPEHRRTSHTTPKCSKGAHTRPSTTLLLLCPALKPALSPHLRKTMRLVLGMKIIVSSHTCTHAAAALWSGVGEEWGQDRGLRRGGAGLRRVCSHE